MGQIQLRPAAGSHGDQFEVATNGKTLGVISWKEVSDLACRQLAQRAPSSIRLKGDESLAVYERRTHPGSACSEDALQLEIGRESIQISVQSARELACVLLAYAGQDNQRWQWLVRVESSQG